MTDLFARAKLFRRCHVLSALAVALCCASGPDAARAQTNVARPSSGNRWLLVVDTSRAMQRRSESLQRIAGTLVLSGMNGQMRGGDTFGVWTYNDELHAGQFRLQTWTSESRRAAASRVVAFLKDQKFEKESHVEKVVTALDPLVKNSDLITVVILSGGEEPIRGTPFDDELNKVYEAWQGEQERARMPILTFLRAERGRFTTQWINTPPWPLEMKPLPAEAKAPAPTPRPAALPLIISGRKPAVTSTQEVSRPVPADLSSPPKPATNAAVVPVEPAVPPANREAETKAAAAATPVSVPTKPLEPPATLATPPPAETIATKESALATPPAGKPASAAEVSSSSTVPNASQNSPAPSAATRSTDGQSRVPTESVAAVPAEPFFQRHLIWIVAVGTGGILFVLGLLWTRRSRDRLHVSLITRSLDRDEK